MISHTYSRKVVRKSWKKHVFLHFTEREYKFRCNVLQSTYDSKKFFNFLCFRTFPHLDYDKFKNIVKEWWIHHFLFYRLHKRRLSIRQVYVILRNCNIFTYDIIYLGFQRNVQHFIGLRMLVCMFTHFSQTITRIATIIFSLAQIYSTLRNSVGFIKVVLKIWR